MKFCPKCGSILVPQVIEGKRYLVCPSCGYKEEVQGGTGFKVRVKIKHSPREKLVVVNANAVPPTASKVKGTIRCPKCGHDELLAWMQQTRAADEPPTRFYRCTKCGYTWREYA